MKQRGLSNLSRLTNVTKLGDRIRRARRQAALSQAALAQLAGVSASAVSQWEHPEGTQPDLGRILQIAKATGVSLDWLIAGKELGLSASIPQKGQPVHEVPAIALDAYARDLLEEQLLERFRNLSLRTRELFLHLMEEVAQRRKRS